MITFLLFCIATVGMTSIITQGSIFLPLRQYVAYWSEKVRERREQWEQKSGKMSKRAWIEWFDELINCAQCTGFWCGLFCGLILFPQGINNVVSLLGLFCCGLGGSFLATFGSNVIDLVFYHKMNALRHLEEQDIILAERRAHLHETQE